MPNWLDVYAPNPEEIANPHAEPGVLGAPSFPTKAAIAWEIMRRFPGVGRVAIVDTAEDSNIPRDGMVVIIDPREGFDRAILLQYVEEELRESILEAGIRPEVRLA